MVDGTPGGGNSQGGRVFPAGQVRCACGPRERRSRAGGLEAVSRRGEGAGGSDRPHAPDPETAAPPGLFRSGRAALSTPPPAGSEGSRREARGEETRPCPIPLLPPASHPFSPDAPPRAPRPGTSDWRVRTAQARAPPTRRGRGASGAPEGQLSAAGSIVPILRRTLRPKVERGLRRPQSEWRGGEVSGVETQARGTPPRGKGAQMSLPPGDLGRPGPHRG